MKLLNQYSWPFLKTFYSPTLNINKMYLLILPRATVVGQGYKELYQIWAFKMYIVYTNFCCLFDRMTFSIFAIHLLTQSLRRGGSENMYTLYACLLIVILEYISYILQGTRTTRPCLSGRVEPDQRVCTGWPLKHSRVVLIHCDKWLMKCTLLYTSTLEKDTFYKVPELHGHV